MKALWFLCVLMLWSCQVGQSQEAKLRPEAQLLFKDVVSTLTISEKNAVFDLTGFAISSNDGQFYFKDDAYSKEFPFAVSLYPMDLNSDGIEEIGITFGNAATSGAVGSSALLLIMNDLGVYERNFGGPGMYSFLSTSNLNFPDICIGGPGMEFPVWRWDGTAYNFQRKITDSQMQDLNPVYWDEASMDYQETIKE